MKSPVNKIQWEDITKSVTIRRNLNPTSIAPILIHEKKEIGIFMHDGLSISNSDYKHEKSMIDSWIILKKKGVE